jgi:hypothetical protein
MDDLVIMNHHTGDKIHPLSLAESVEIHHISRPPSAESVEIQDAPSPPPSRGGPVEIQGTPAEEKSIETQANTDDTHAPKVTTESLIHRTTNPFHPPIPQTVNTQAKPAHYYSVSPIHIDPSVYSYTSVTPPHSRVQKTFSNSSFTTVFGGSKRRSVSFVEGEDIVEKHGRCSCCWS